MFIFLKLGRKSTAGAKAIDRGSLFLPVAGKIISRSTIARFTRTLGTLIRAGVPILDALTITRETTGNAVFANALSRVYQSVQQGNSFAQPLGEAKVCDTMVVNMIDVGEETGELDGMLLRVADNYDEEVDVLVQSLTSLLEPIMVCSLGLIVGFIVIALFMPLVTLIQGVQ
jgi:type IV pilus assembly protein PilC